MKIAGGFGFSPILLFRYFYQVFNFKYCSSKYFFSCISFQVFSFDQKDHFLSGIRHL